MMENGTSVYFFIEEKEYAYRYLEEVPSIGDCISFNNTFYRVLDRIWIYYKEPIQDEEYKVIIHMKKITKYK